ncbi:GumC family protein [Paracidobacterium acidisoli]|uniref:non-specific protein-tyrosine kinase n=1 Tax=Paracidobacterium acidisoli TaxID=2303751 RepID=A0A372IRG7_9BACT|nr:polysaccharide biosynthesis tyrosine autokinase [Paracidobacterium acidisoli]MBT9330414.1 polysaccharide biosynthesis tyrosine autokinase [Paracidobacterium acidisoli]
MQGSAIAPQGQQELHPPGGVPPHESPAFTPADFRKIIIKRKWVILFCVLVGVGIAFYHIFTTIPQYEAISRMSIDFSRSTNIGIEDIIESKLSGGEESDQKLQTELRIMQSDSVVMDVINSLDLYHRKPFSDMFAKQPYTGHLTPLQRYQLIRAFQSSEKVIVETGTQIVEIHFQNPDPEVAAKVVNAIVQAYMERDLRSRFEGTTRVSNWLSQQLSTLKSQVQSSQQELSDYQKKNNLVGLGPTGTSLVTDDLRTINDQLAEARADRIVKEARYRMAQTRNPDLLVSVSGGVLGSLRSQEADLMVQKAQLQSKFGPEYPKLREIDRQLGSVRSDIQTEITNLTQRFQTEYDAAVKTEGLLQQRLDDTKQQAFHENESAAQFEILQHGAESASELYDALQMKLKEAGITAGLNSNNIDVIDTAMIPPYPVLPQKRQDATFGFLGGLIVGLILAVFLESMDDTLRTSDDAEAVSLLPALAVIPHFQPFSKKAINAKDEAADRNGSLAKVSPDLLAYNEPQSIVAEGFRSLRSSILLSAVDREPKLLLLTSGFAAEGKSTCSSNLAVSFAQRNARVLLVDTDLRKGTLHMKFRLSNRTGLSTYLSRESKEESFEYPIPGLPNLAVMTRGPIAPNPGEMLASRMMEDTLARWRQEFDHVILDSSPILAVSDTLSLAPQADAVLIVLRSGITRKKALSRVREQLRRSGARVLGTIINDVDLRLENYYTYSRRYDYGYKGYKGYGSAYGAGYAGGKDGEE